MASITNHTPISYYLLTSATVIAVAEYEFVIAITVAVEVTTAFVSSHSCYFVTRCYALL
jgi:hypothetical protein